MFSRSLKKTPPDHLSKHSPQITLSQKKSCAECSFSHTHYHSSAHDVRETSAESCDPVAGDSLLRAGWHHHRAQIYTHTAFKTISPTQERPQDRCAGLKPNYHLGLYIYLANALSCSQLISNLGWSAELSVLQSMMKCICFLQSVTVRAATVICIQESACQRLQQSTCATTVSGLNSCNRDSTTE